MRRRLVAAVVVAFAVGGAAGATTGWRVFATGADTGAYGAFASASGNVVAPKGLAVRVNAPSDVSFSLFCSGEKKGAKPGVVYVVGVNTSQKCSLNGDATTGSGGVKIQLLRR